MNKTSFRDLNTTSNFKGFCGRMPCARDGHSCVQYKNSMIIMGGDRHLMSFSDVFEFIMDGNENIAE